jgi:hypothetical protein
VSPGTLSTLHDTALFVVFETEATKFALKPALTVAVCGDTLTVMVCGVTVTVADADFVASAVEVAVTITVADVETSAGATYRPLESMLPALAVQVTGDAPLAVNCW